MNYDPDELKDRIKTTVTMDDVLEMCNITLPNNRKITSIYNPEENTPSLHVYKHDYFDFSTGRGGDQITFVMDYFTCSYGKALKFLARVTDDMVHPTGPAGEKELPDLGHRFYSEPEGDDSSYDLARALIAENWPTVDLEYIMKWFGVMVAKHALWVPHYSPEEPPGFIRGIKTRSLYTGGKHSVKTSTYTTSLYRAVNKDPQFNSVIVEGESDCWTMTKAVEGHPIRVFGLPGGAGLWRDSWLEQLGPGDVTIVLDDDKPGQEAAAGIREAIKNAPGRQHMIIRSITAPGGRVTEALAKGWEPMKGQRWVKQN